jgi:iron-sulfur cluster assembly accessory protein
MSAEETKFTSILLTPAATKAVQDLLIERQLENHALRVYVAGSSCSGFQYGMALESNIREQDNVVEFNGTKVVIDEVSIQYLRGSIIDYIDDPDGGGFRIDNPNEISSCSSGNCNSDCC